MDISTVQILILVCGFALTVATFLFTRSKEAENRGRLMQRVDELEKVIAEIRGRTRTVEEDIACHDMDLSKVTTELGALKALVEKIDKKLDSYFERRDHQRVMQ
jgi:septal ring factor EnvC (AmiA/AmiB activator)